MELMVNNMNNRHKFQQIFEFMKTKGLFTQFATYEEYEKHTEPAKEGKDIEESIKNQKIKNEEEPPKEDFRSLLSEEEKRQWDKLGF